MPSKNKGGAAFKTARINEEISRELTDILRTVKDPRVSASFLSIVGVETTPDLKYCKVRFSVYGGDAKEVGKGLRSAAGYIRRELAHRINLRNTPQISFVLDQSIEYGVNMSRLIDEVTRELHDGSDDGQS